jgi:hypothetical protein
MAAKRIKRPKRSTRTQPRKQSSSRVSTEAAQLVAKYERLPADEFIFVKLGFLRSLCMCIIGQDEVKGQSPAKARKGAKR